MPVFLNILSHKFFKTAFFISIFIFLTGGLQARIIPERNLPDANTVSPQIAPLVNANIADWVMAVPKNLQEWQRIRKELNDNSLKLIPKLLEEYKVKCESGTMAGVPIFELTPQTISKENINRVLLFIHGGGYVLNSGIAGISEAVPLAALGHIRIIAADYRLAPEHPYPAALNDVMAVYKELLKNYPAKNIGVFGTSTGGGLTLALPLAAKKENLPMPGAIAPGTPWSDLTKTGDSYYTNEQVDNILGGYDGWLGEAAKVYANGHNLKDPLLSPVYGDVKNFPPVLLTSGTRDLFLSNTVRMHAKLRESDIPADLIVIEGLSHAEYYMIPDSPEALYYYRELKKFFDKNLGQ